MKLVFETNDIFMFQKDWRSYTGGQIIIIEEMDGNNFTILGDIRKDGEQKPVHVSISVGWLETLYSEGTIKYLGRL